MKEGLCLSMLAKTLWPMCLSFLEHLPSPTDNQNKLCTLATIWPWSEFGSEFGLNVGLNFGLSLV